MWPFFLCSSFILDFASLGRDSARIAQGWEIVSIGVFKQPWKSRPVKPPSEVACTCKFEEGILDPQLDPGSFHSPFCGFQLQYQVTGFVIEGFVELMHCIGQFLNGLNELRED